MYRRKHHQLISTCLSNFNSQYLVEHNILFGGGMRITLELDEYRESVDIDFRIDRERELSVRVKISYIRGKGNAD